MAKKIANTRLERGLWIAGGWISVVLGVIGAVLPVMPTTPFLLLAAFCFSRGSERLHDWIVNHKKFGHSIRLWNEHRVIPVRAKIIALSMMAVGGTFSYFGVPERMGAWRYAGLSLISVGAVFILLQKSEKSPKSEARHPASKKTRT